jgi:hypothetical protein
VDEFCRESRQTPEQQFGPAAYAKTFPAAGGQHAPRNGLLVMLGVIALALAYVVFRWQVVYDSVSDVGRVPMVLLLVTAQLVTIALTFASSYRLPKGFDLTGDGPA